MRRDLLILLLGAAMLWLGCPSDDDDVADDDTTPGDDDTGDDDTTPGDDDDTTPGDDDDTSDDDDTTPGDDDDDTSDDDDTVPPVDADGDGYPETVDCDDSNAEVHPGASEVCNGIDDDCDGAADLQVPAAYAAIQDAIDAAVDDDLVCVSAGTYIETIDPSGKAIHVLGVDGPDATFIDAGGADSVALFHSGEGADTILEGFTLRNGNAAVGGGVNADLSSPTLTNLIITDNTAEQGGGLFLDSCSPTLTGVTITGNVATENGGGGMYLYFASPAMQQISIQDNTAAYGGGGIFMHESDPVLHSVMVANNEAVESPFGSGGNGGGIYLYHSDPGLTQVVVAGNHVNIYGGGMYFHTCQPSLTSVAIAGNTTDGGGAGIYMTESTPSMMNVALVGNEAGCCGGGMYLNESSPSLSNVVIADNRALDLGGSAIYVYTGSPALSYCAVWGNAGTAWIGMDDPTGVGGTVAADPLFLDTSGNDPATWDLHLGAGSDLVDAGHPVLTDPDGSTSDMGVYGGADAGTRDVDGDGFPQWWQPGAYDNGTYPAQGWDCDDSDPDEYPGNGC